MSPRLAFALLTIVFVVGAPATAGAQAPPDERANARAFADIGLRLAEELETASKATAGSPDEPPACLTEGRLARRLERAPRGRGVGLNALFATGIIGTFARAADPTLTHALANMHAIQTADPGLRGGRTAWRRIHRVYASIGAVPVVELCGEARAFVRSGYRPTPSMRLAHRTLDAAEHTGGINRRLARAVTRLAELGVPAADADLFDGPFGDE